MKSYEINCKDDIKNIPDEFIREFAYNCYDAYQEMKGLLKAVLEPTGIKIQEKSSIFTPDGKGYKMEVDEIKVVSEEEFKNTK